MDAPLAPPAPPPVHTRRPWAAAPRAPRALPEDEEAAAHMLIDFARNDQWDELFRALSTRPELVDFRPKVRQYSILHQAIYFGRDRAVARLLDEYNADPAQYTRDHETCWELAEYWIDDAAQRALILSLLSGPQFDAADLAAACQPLKTKMWMLGSVEFGLTPVFMYLGFKCLTTLGTVLVYVSYICVTLAKIKVMSGLSRTSSSFRSALILLKKLPYTLPIIQVNTPISRMPAIFLMSIPMFCDNFTLSLAIGDVQAVWNKLLQSLWSFTWRKVPLMSVAAEYLSLPMVLVIMMGISCITHVRYFCRHMCDDQLGCAARVANLNLIAELIKETKRDESNLAPKKTNSETQHDRNKLAPTITNPSDFMVRCEEPLLAQQEETATPAVIPASTVPEKKKCLEDIGFGVDKEAFEREELEAYQSRFVAKIVLGCSLRMWFKVSLLVLLYIATAGHTSVVWQSVGISILHTTLGTYPYVEKIVVAEHLNFRAKARRLLLVLVALAPVWMSFVRIGGIFFCDSRVFAFTTFGCESKKKVMAIVQSSGVPGHARCGHQ